MPLSQSLRCRKLLPCHVNNKSPQNPSDAPHCAAKLLLPTATSELMCLSCNVLEVKALTLESKG